MIVLASLPAGLVFGLVLLVSGMTNPAKVLGFLDLAGPWEPTLAFVMAGAMAAGLVAFAAARRRTVSLLGARMHLPTARQIDPLLVGGSLLFGAGWGIAGTCPRPGLVVLGMGEVKALVHVPAVLAGMGLFELRERRRAWRRRPRPEAVPRLLAPQVVAGSRQAPSPHQRRMLPQWRRAPSGAILALAVIQRFARAGRGRRAPGIPAPRTGSRDPPPMHP